MFGYLPAANTDSGDTVSSARFTTITISDGLEHPWSMAFLPDGKILVTERPGRLRIIENGSLQPKAIEGLPAIVAKGQGGLLDVVLHPDYAKNGWIYLSYTAGSDNKIGTEVGRGRLVDNRITDWQTLFRLEPKSTTSRHFGSRLVFDRENFLYITLGDRGERFRAQDLNDHAGSVIRVHDDGAIPSDNPFVNQAGIQPQIYSFGHRNIQGAVLHPETGKVWIHEHGPQGGDELNIIEAGQNYGWPIITYGKEYGSGDDIGEGTHKDGMLQPIRYWTPSIAPSGMAFYNGDKFPDWQGNLFIGSLKFQLLVRLELSGNKILHEERLLKKELGRIRDVRNGPDGYLYLLTDEKNGKLVRLQP
ncbi:MAG: PQQ-dependent sugar dehydrogenase [Gammaproteobacteria bacterium]|nr:MAG: PQQ-dependent sugar dehydrogenase [Gammaproteobacteria bacterium]